MKEQSSDLDWGEICITLSPSFLFSQFPFPKGTAIPKAVPLPVDKVVNNVAGRQIQVQETLGLILFFQIL